MLLTSTEELDEHSKQEIDKYIRQEQEKLSGN